MRGLSRIRRSGRFRRKEYVGGLRPDGLAIPIALQLANELDPAYRLSSGSDDTPQRDAPGVGRRATDRMNHRIDLVAVAPLKRPTISAQDSWLQPNLWEAGDVATRTPEDLQATL